MTSICQLCFVSVFKWCKHHETKGIPGRIFMFWISKQSRKTFSLFHFILANSTRARMTMLRLFFLLAFVFFLGSSVTPQNKSSNRVITKVNLSSFENLWKLQSSNVFVSCRIRCHLFKINILMYFTRKVYLLIPTYSFRVLVPQSNHCCVPQTVCSKDGKSKLSNVFTFANKNTLLIISCLFVYFFWKGKMEKMEKMDKTVRFSIILVC